MKYVIVIPDGAAPTSRKSRSAAKRPSKAAHTRRTWYRIVAEGVRRPCLPPRPLRFPPAPKSATSACSATNPFDYFTGRAPMEAAAQGIQLGPEDWAIRCNLVTIEDQVMRDFNLTADHIKHRRWFPAPRRRPANPRHRPQIPRRDPVHARR